MATSPNYGWSEPDNSSLVKNGAADIRTLGDAIDTSLWNVGVGQAGKNKVINSDFGIWQRGTTFTFTGSGGMTADRYEGSSGSGGVATFSRQTFTPGTAPVNGYAGTYYIDANYTTSGTSTVMLENKIEDVTTFANQPITFSFWGKVSTGTHTITPEVVQRFGTGGSSAIVTSGTDVTFTTSWTRYSVSISVPAITGKTVGAGSSTSVRLKIGTSGIKTFSTWGWQAEYGSKATPFQTASGGNPQQELAMCQRYYEKSYDITTAPGASTGAGSLYLTQSSDAGANSAAVIRFKTEKRNSTWSAALYTTSGTGTTTWQFARSGVSATNLTMTIDSQGTSGFRTYGSVGAAWTANTIQGHWVVDNEL